MKNLTLAFLLVLFLVSCGKEDDQLKIEEKLNISRIILAPDRILLKKQDKFYISLRYWKEENLTNTDEINLTVDGVKAKLVKQKANEPLVGSNILFEVSPINSSGDVKVAYTIKSNNKLYAGEGSLRIVDDFSIATIWNKLDRDYVKTIPFTTEVYQSGDFALSGASTAVGGGEIIVPEMMSFFIGDYRSSYQAPRLLVSKPLIQGLEGIYIITFENSSLKELRLSIGSTNADPNFNKNALFAELNSLYGVPTITNINSRTLRTHQHGAFDIIVTDNGGEISAVVKKVR